MIKHDLYRKRLVDQNISSSLLKKFCTHIYNTIYLPNMQTMIFLNSIKNAEPKSELGMLNAIACL